MNRFFQWLDRHRDTGIFLLRLFVGFRLLVGVVDNMFSWPRMLEFGEFLRQFGFPLPVACAVVSASAQLIAALLIITGIYFRYAALLMIVNFTVALVMVHWGQQLEEMTTSLLLLFIFIFFLFQGPGRYSVEAWSRKQAG